MPQKTDTTEIDSKIRSLQKNAEELNQMAEDFPALARNTARTLASIKMLEIKIADLVGLNNQD